MKRHYPPADSYPLGHFTELVRLYDWPPGFVGSPLDPKNQQAIKGKIGGAIVSAKNHDPMRSGALTAITKGRGTLGKLSPRSDAEIGRNAAIRLGGI